MDRKEFLATLGLGAAVIACNACLSGCSKTDNVTGPPTSVDFTLDLTDPANAALNTAGGYVYNGGVIVARASSSSFVAVSQVCTHAGGTVRFDGTQFVCPVHGSTFRTDGSVSRGPAASALARYNTALNGNSLRVYS
jgi:cytochrome b6-f complex iron-sulfur subunit